MDLYRFFDGAQILRNLLVPAPRNQMVKHFQLSRRQRGQVAGNGAQLGPYIAICRSLSMAY